MTREEREAAIAYIKGYRKLDEDLHNTSPKDSISYYATDKCLKYWDMAIQSLSQEPTDDATLKDIFCMGCEYKEQEPCTDTVSIRKDVLKCRVGKIVAYNVEWLKKHWQMEMDIVCGVKPCDDAISRNAAITAINKLYEECEEWRALNDLQYGKNQGLSLAIAVIEDLPSVTQKSGKWIKVKSGDKDFPESIVCSRCNNENSHLDFNENAEPIGKVFVTSKYCPDCGAKMVEPQESEDNTRPHYVNEWSPEDSLYVEQGMLYD